MACEASGLDSMFDKQANRILNKSAHLASQVCWSPSFPQHDLPDILISTRRVVARFVDLSPEEVSDLFLCAHRVAPVIQREYRGTSLTIAVQVVGRGEGGWAMQDIRMTWVYVAS